MAGKLLAHLRQQWIGVTAMLLVLTGGTAYALDGSNTVFSDDIVDGEVKVADIGQGAVRTDELANDEVKAADVAPEGLTGADIAGNSLKGSDVDEGSLAGALIPGIATSGLVKSSGVVRVDDPPGTSLTTKPLVSSGPLSITGLCQDDAGEQGAQVIATSSADNWSIQSHAVGGENAFDIVGPTPQSMAFATSGGGGGMTMDSGDYVLVTPNKLLAGEVAAGVNLTGTDCLFGVTGMG